MCHLHCTFKGKTTWILVAVYGVPLDILWNRWFVKWQLILRSAILLKLLPRCVCMLATPDASSWSFTVFTRRVRCFLQGPSPLWLYLHSTGKTFALLNAFNSSLNDWVQLPIQDILSQGDAGLNSSTQFLANIFSGKGYGRVVNQQLKSHVLQQQHCSIASYVIYDYDCDYDIMIDSN